MSGKRPILVVDDDPVLREALSRILRTEGHAVIEASDGESALALSRSHAPSLVLLDGFMPGMDGEMVLSAIQKELADDAPPAVVLTANGTQTERAVRGGAVFGLCKPFQVEDLLSAVERFKRDSKPDA